jgi:hypothetical protein
MRLQDDLFCAECFAEERSHSDEGVSSIGRRFTECIFSFFSLGEKSSQVQQLLQKEQLLRTALLFKVRFGGHHHLLALFACPPLFEACLHRFRPGRPRHVNWCRYC